MRSLSVVLLIALVTVWGCAPAAQNGEAPASSAPATSTPAYPEALRPFGMIDDPNAVASDEVASPALAVPGESVPPESNTEAYDSIEESRFLTVQESPFSTFGIDVDTASYSNVRRFLTNGSLPPSGAVRIEELINYFPYKYTPPDGAEPFAMNAEVAACPWRPEHRLVRVGLKGKEMAYGERPACQLVFLVDVSGSMDAPNRLPLVQRSLSALVASLDEQDQIAIVTYAGSSGVALPSTSARQKHTLITAIESLRSGGSTNGAAGIVTAYQLARQNFIEQGINRVILCTDGDFNVGTTDASSLVELIQKEAQSGVFLSVLGFGMGNYQDSRMEQLADKGNGNYAYIDSYAEARKVLVEQMVGTLVTIAKDVKIQVEFNPAQVQAYRLIGYENRALATQDFRNDQKDAGEIGAGHTVTALYEVVPQGIEFATPDIPESKYQKPSKPTREALADELMNVRVRYQPPAGGAATELEFAIRDTDQRFERASKDFQFASAVAAFGMQLRNSKHKGVTTWDAIQEWASPAASNDAEGYRQEFLTLVEMAKRLQPTPVAIRRVR